MGGNYTMKQMRKSICKLVAIFMAVIMILSFNPVNAQAATKMKINKTKTTIYMGDSTSLKVTGTNKKIKWTSSNKKVATVTAKGKVTAKKVGKTVITAKVAGKKFKCTVVVKKPCLTASVKGNTYKIVLHGGKIKKHTSNKKITIKKINDKTLKVTVKKKIGIVKIKVNTTNGKSLTYKINTEAPTTEHQHQWTEEKWTETIEHPGEEVFGCECDTCGFWCTDPAVMEAHIDKNGCSGGYSEYARSTEPTTETITHHRRVCSCGAKEDID